MGGHFIFIWVYIALITGEVNIYLPFKCLFICLSLKFLLLWISCSYCSTHFYNFGPFIFICVSPYILFVCELCCQHILPNIFLFMMHFDHKRHWYFHRFKLADLLLWALEFITCLGRRAFLYKDYKNIQYFWLLFFYIQLFNPFYFSQLQVF